VDISTSSKRHEHVRLNDTDHTMVT